MLVGMKVRGGGGGGGGGRGVYWNRRVLVSVSLSICLPGFVQKISSEQLNLLYPNLIWWCIVLSRCVMHMNWGLYNHSMTVSTISMLSTQTSSELTVVVVFLCVCVGVFVFCFYRT